MKRRNPSAVTRMCTVHCARCTVHSALESGGMSEPTLHREIGLWRGVALNMIDMVGIGPFITIPLILTAMGGGRGMLA